MMMMMRLPLPPLPLMKLGTRSERGREVKNCAPKALKKEKRNDEIKIESF